MLEIRPTCEHCNKQLPPESKEAMICTFECTFCQDCVKNILYNVCPNCGGGFSPRPIRPKSNWKDDNYLEKYPASRNEILQPVDISAHNIFSAKLKQIEPADR